MKKYGDTIPCRGCDLDLPRSDYPQNSLKKSDRRCRECQKRDAKAWREKNPDRAKETREKNRKRYKEEGKCKACPTRSGATLCTDCRRKDRARLRALGLCIYCTKPSGGARRCPECKQKERLRDQAIKRAKRGSELTNLGPGEAWRVGVTR